MKHEFFLEIFEKYSNIKLDENPSCGNRVVRRGRMDGQIDMTKLMVAFAVLRTRLKIKESLTALSDRLCGLVVRVSGYRYRGPGFDPRRYQIF